MFVCYLDDSNDDQSSVATIAGYVQHLREWEAFEESAELVYSWHGIEGLHAMDFHRTKGQFKGWTLGQKDQFVRALYCGLPHSLRGMPKMFPNLFGLSISQRKDGHREQHVAAGFHNSSVYGSAFNSFLSYFSLLSDKSGSLDQEGVSFVVESGKYVAEFSDLFRKFKKKGPGGGRLRSLSFVGKSDSRAIQLADLYAFYSRRQAAKIDRLNNPDTEQMKACQEKLYRLIASQCDHYMGITQSLSQIILDADEVPTFKNPGWKTFVM